MGWFDFIFNPSGGGGGVQHAMSGGSTLQPEPIGGPAGLTQGTPGGSGGGSIYEQLFNSPQFRTAALSNALMSAGASLLKNSGPSTTPRSFGQILGGGLESGMQGFEGTRDRFTRDLQLKSALDTASLARDTQRGWMDFMKRFATPGGAGVGTPTPGGGPAGGGSFFDRWVAGESGGNPQAVNPHSGFSGRLQLAPGTFQAARAAIPGLPEDPRQTSVEQDKAIADWYLAQSAPVLARSLGRAPTQGELGLSTLAGASGASALLRLDPATPITSLPDDFWQRLGEKFTHRTFLQQNPNIAQLGTVGGVVDFFNKRFGGASAGPMTAAAPAPRPAAPQVQTSAGGMIPRVSSPDQVASLAPGTPFFAPDGSLRVR